MKTSLARLWPAILCALIFLACALFIRPYAELPIIDDGSYVRTAQLLAQTGHIAYNGWAAPILGWLLFLAALLIKIFGFSFTVVRSSVMLVAMTTAFLLQRTFVRAGIHDWNAALGTMALMLSPLFLPLSLVFMTDIPGLFCVVLCLYACLRAMQAQTSGSAFAWICFAAASNAIGGTVRQIAWLGVLVMVPSTLWLMRRRRRILLPGFLVWIAGVISIVAFVHWFYQQPYSVHENIIEGPIGRQQLRNLYRGGMLSALNLPVYLLPVLLMFIPAFPRRNRRAVLLVALGALACLVLAAVLAHRNHLDFWIYPIGDWASIHGAADGQPIHGQRPVLLPFVARLLITGSMFAGLFCLLVFLLFDNGQPRPQEHKNQPPQPENVTWRQLGVLLFPLALGYIALVLPRAIYGAVYDRYIIIPTMIAMLVLLRLYQNRVQLRLPLASALLVIVIAGYSLASTHDTFSMYRARLAAIQELRSAGIAATSIDAGFDSNAWTQIDHAGYLKDPRDPLPAGQVAAPSIYTSDLCPLQMANWLPAINPLYALSFDPTACAGQSRFAPVTYREWLRPRSVTIYIVDTAH